MTTTTRYLTAPLRDGLVQQVRLVAQEVSNTLGPIELQDWDDDRLIELGQMLLGLSNFIRGES